MAIKFEKVAAGMTLWSRGTYRNGANRPVKAEWDVHILEVDAARRRARVSKNGRTEWWSARMVARLYTKRMERKP